jgi:hypothetical protein
MKNNRLSDLLVIALEINIAVYINIDETNECIFIN